ncbi:MAG: NUDIX hydrolase [Candidatus Hodarchaeales archaeon]|jgi:ADP-ribose pyrophosphatase YjhB (NUDIX family)
MSSRKYPKRPWVSAHAIIFNDKKEILLTKRAAPPKRNYWFPPGGAIDLGEKVEEGLEREIMEETTIKVRNLHFIDYIDAITSDDDDRIVFHYVVFMFSANYLEGTAKAKDDALEVKWSSIEDILSSKYPVPKELVTIVKKMKY